MVRRVLSALLASRVIAGCATTSRSFPNARPGKPLSVTAWEERPEGPGPFPAVVLMHGCHGVSESNHEWWGWSRDKGYVPLLVDSGGPRRYDKTCAPNTQNTPDLPNTERFDDAVGALRWLHTRPYVDPARIGVIGWSNGGVFALAVVNGPSLERARRRGVVLPQPRFPAPVGFYPGCGHPPVGDAVIGP